MTPPFHPNAISIYPVQRVSGASIIVHPPFPPPYANPVALNALILTPSHVFNLGLTSK